MSQPDLTTLEKGIKSPDRHAVLAVRGMTCTGCENKLISALRAIPAISNNKTNEPIKVLDWKLDFYNKEWQRLYDKEYSVTFYKLFRYLILI